MTHISLAAKAVHFILLQPVHLKPLQVVHLFRCTQGKSWLATAIGRQACMLGHKVRYFGTQKLFEHIALARLTSTVHKCFDQLSSTELLIIDDFGIRCLDSQQVLDLMEIVEDRHGRKSTMIVSQLPVSEWYGILSVNTTAADAILDRLVHSAVRFMLKGDSLRK